MKKIFFIFCLILSIASNLCSQSWDFFYETSKYNKYSEKNYITLNKSYCYDKNGSIIETIEANKIFKSSQFAYVQDESSQPFFTFEYLIGNEDCWISTDNLALAGSDVFPDTIISVNRNKFNKQWVPVWYNEILNSGNKLQDYSDNYRRHYIPLESRYLYVDNPGYIELDTVHHIEFKNTFFQFIETYGDGIFSINNIKKNNNIYKISCELDKSSQTYFTADFSKESFNNLPDLTENRETTFIIEPNGNRIRMYNGETKKLIVELMQADAGWVDSMIGYIKSDYTDKPSGLKPIEEKLDHPWSDPVTGLYIENKAFSSTDSTTNVSLNKIMTTNCNLKLRSAEATSSSVITVMSKGTKVKVLELGNKETIDGLTSSWVKVEVTEDAKDKDGKPIKKGIVGWCYGGYLEDK